MVKRRLTKMKRKVCSLRPSLPKKNWTSLNNRPLKNLSNGYLVKNSTPKTYLRRNLSAIYTSVIIAMLGLGLVCVDIRETSLESPDTKYMLLMCRCDGTYSL